MKIRKAKKEDVNFVLNGIKEICKIEKEKINSIKFLDKRVLNNIRKKRIILLEVEGKPVGFLEFIFSKKQPYGIDYEDEKKEFCWVNNMFVVKEFRRKGVGNDLFQELERICKKRKIKVILLDVFRINRKAGKFYKKEDFNPKIYVLEKKLKW